MAKRPAHRPSEYQKAGGDEKVPQIVFQLALLGATEEEIGTAFGVNRRTITNWEKQFPKFKESLNNGRMLADAEVVKSLFERAKGYSHEEDKIFQYEGEPVVVPTTKHYPPDTTAAIFWLKNRRRAQWRDKQEHEHSGPDGGPMLVRTLDDFYGGSEAEDDRNG
ncbi:MAG: helix-turn-helix domain-containing protein [Pseudomonadota bacterium]